MGEFESLNFSIGILSEDIALFHALYRTSIKGRKDLVSLQFSDLDSEMDCIESSYTSRVAEIFNVILKSLGIGVDFIDTDNELMVFNDSEVKLHKLNGESYFCTDYQFFIIERIDELKKEILSKYPVITESQMRQKIENELKNRKYVNGPLREILQDLNLSVDRDITDILLEASKKIITFTDEGDVIGVDPNVEVKEEPKKKITRRKTTTKKEVVK